MDLKETKVELGEQTPSLVSYEQWWDSRDQSEIAPTEFCIPMSDITTYFQQLVSAKRFHFRRLTDQEAEINDNGSISVGDFIRALEMLEVFYGTDYVRYIEASGYFDIVLAGLIFSARVTLVDPTDLSLKSMVPEEVVKATILRTAMMKFESEYNWTLRSNGGQMPLGLTDTYSQLQLFIASLDTTLSIMKIGLTSKPVVLEMMLEAIGLGDVSSLTVH